MMNVIIVMNKLYMQIINTNNICYLKVTIICRYIFLRFWLGLLANIKFRDLYAEMVQGRQNLMFHTTTASLHGYKILRVWANPQKYQTLISAKVASL